MGEMVFARREEERILTLLAVAYRGDVPARRWNVSPRIKTLQRGDKCLAAIHLAQSGLPEIDEDAPIACRWRPSDRRGHDAAQAGAGARSSPGSV